MSADEASSPSPVDEVAAESPSYSPNSPKAQSGGSFDAEDVHEKNENEADQSPPASPPASPSASPPASPPVSPSSTPKHQNEDPDSRSSSPIGKTNDTPKKKAIIMDSDDDDEADRKSDSSGPSNNRKRALIDSDESDNEEQAKKRLIGSDASDDDEDSHNKSSGKQLFGDDSDDGEDSGPKRVDQDDDDEFADKNEEYGNNQKAQSDDDDDIIDDRRRGDDDRGGHEWDFDVMLREKKAERKKKTKRGKDGGIDIINDDDGAISHLVERMKHAAKADRNANVDRKPAFQKIKLLPEVRLMMLRAGIVEALIENGFMSAVSEWLAPLPDKCLPALDIRITMLKLLHNPRFWKLDRSTLKQSGLGKAVMLLYKHPNETKENKLIANKLIGEWARPIFQLDTDYSAMSKEERVVMDYDRMPEVKKKKLNFKRLQDDDDDEPRERRKPQLKEHGEIGPTSSGQLKPGDKGYINRARVPKPSTKDYVVRPKWNIEGECKDRKATGTKRYDQAFRDFQERTKKSKAGRAITVSLEGRNLQI